MADLREHKKIQYTYEGVDYTLEYTPLSIRKMEQSGFDFTKMEQNIINVPYDLFRGAFIARHNYVPVDKRDEMYEALIGENEEGQNLLECLGEMLKDEIDFIVSKPRGKVKWEMV